ncbi:MAG: cytochrome c, partial [Verrucomicrobia bacterium]|nr:cytochrome c [Verrucomicrobiota bacterium]
MSAVAPCLLSLLTATFAAAAETPPGNGASLFLVNCAACHQPTGEGLRGIFPPLAKSDYLLADKERSIRIALQGTSGPLTVNGVEYQGVMPAPAASQAKTMFASNPPPGVMPAPAALGGYQPPAPAPAPMPAPAVALALAPAPAPSAPAPAAKASGPGDVPSPLSG